ncbi:NmrA family NAD(P)-binding protein [Algoriphagus sp.]|uniref:NmrA family NAD(P)-binding protein n=1 Tax=Algoriphagus sp. TaxID=1872435 RepID=UPI003F6E60FD
MNDTAIKIFLVSGASGTIGREVVSELQKKKYKVRILTRDINKTEFPKDVEVITGNLTDTESLEKAFEGVYAAHLISIGDDNYTPLPNGKAIVKMLQKSGVKRITVLWNGEGNESTLEKEVKDSKLHWTILQPQEYMSNALGWVESIHKTNEVKEPFGDRPTAAIHENDVGNVIATILSGGGRSHHEKTYTLTGPEILTPRKQVDRISRALGQKIVFHELSEEQTRSRWKEWGLSVETMDYLYNWYGNTPAQGYTITSVVEDVLGKPALTFEEWVSDNINKFRQF